MVETVIALLIWICVIALCYFLIVWVLGKIGLDLPPMVLNIIQVIFVLVVILLLYKALLGGGIPMPLALR